MSFLCQLLRKLLIHRNKLISNRISYQVHTQVLIYMCTHNFDLHVFMLTGIYHPLKLSSGGPSYCCSSFDIVVVPLILFSDEEIDQKSGISPTHLYNTESYCNFNYIVILVHYRYTVTHAIPYSQK